MSVSVKKNPTRVAICCRKGDPFQGPKLGSCLTLGNELSEENCSAVWLAVLGFMVMGLVSGWSLANHSNSESFLVVHASLSQDGC